MIIDNSEQIKKLIANCGKGEFYMLQILHRSKDGKTPYEPEGKTISQQIIKTYYVSSPEYLDYKMAEIRDLCEMFNARAYINLNKKSWKQISLASLKLLAGIISDGETSPDGFRSVKSVIDSACGQTGACDKNKTWVVDVDTKEEFELNTIKRAIAVCEPKDTEKIVATLPTLHGYHIITRPFNKQTFKVLYPNDLEIKDNNPTLLFFKEKNKEE